MIPIPAHSFRRLSRRSLLFVLPLVLAVIDPVLAAGASPAWLPDPAPSVYKPFLWSLIEVWNAESNQVAGRFGAALATAGDVNGDGFSDVVVGAPLYDDGFTDQGRVSVYAGTPTGLPAVASWTATGDQEGTEFGRAVAVAGDVNGDGFADVLIGAPRHDGAAAADAGRVVVYHGSPSGLTAAPAWVLEGDRADANLGSAVATAGDVNGDGYADVILGAPGQDGGAIGSGRVLVYHGSPSGLTAAAAWVLEGDRAGANLGAAVATAGDVNGDGYADVIIGAPGHDGGVAGGGRALVYHGSPSGLTAAAAWVLDGEQADANLGSAAATAGDVNGDGYADVIIGAPGHDGGVAGGGRALVYHGSPSGLTVAPAWMLDGEQADANLGSAVATAGDVDGDGFADVLIGASRYDNGQRDEGRVYLHVGSAGGLLAAASWMAEPHQAGAAFGAAGATAGDVNGDGFSDILVGAPGFNNGQSGEGRAYLYRGRGASAAATTSWVDHGPHLGADFGISVATAGDVNGDGYSDVIIGSRFYHNGEADEGRVLVYHGAPAGLEQQPAWIFESNQAGTLLGYAVGTAGDVNGDGYSDVIAGGYDYDGDGGLDEGAAFVFLGSPSGLVGGPAWLVTGGQAGARLGIAVGSAGDVNGDGLSDVIVGAYTYDTTHPSAGRVEVFHGSPSGLPLTPNWSATGGQASELFGASVGSAGDVNGDGFSDVVIGAPGFGESEINAGRAYVYCGSPDGLAADPAWVVGSNQSGASFGSRVATAGDVNGDGFSDLLVGAPAHDDGEADEGAAFLYPGSRNGLARVPLVTFQSDQAGAAMGFPVAPAGDVNGDGMSDVLVGAWRFDNGERDEGRVYLHHGAMEGPGPVAYWIAEGNQIDGEFGFSAAGIGDVDGDGFGDVMIGAPGYDGAAWNEGKAFLYLGNDGGGRDRCPRQVRFDGLAPIWLLNRSDYPSCFGLRLIGRTPAGRSRVRLEWEVKLAGQKLDGSGLETGPGLDSGGAGVLLAGAATGLTPKTLYHWRLRIKTDSPFFPRSPWLWLPYNGSAEADVSTGPIQVAVPEAPAPRAGFTLGPGMPSPFRLSTVLRFSLPERGQARLRVYDVSGRLVSDVLDEEKPAGRHEVRWDGRDRDGIRLPAGVYLARLDFAGRTATSRLVLLR